MCIKYIAHTNMKQHCSAQVSYFTTPVKKSKLRPEDKIQHKSTQRRIQREKQSFESKERCRLQDKVRARNSRKIETPEATEHRLAQVRAHTRDVRNAEK